MNELASISSNLLAIYDQQHRLIPSAEVVLIMTEPTYTIDAGGVVKSRRVVTTRFSAGPAQLRHIAKAMLNIADQTEESLEQALTQKPTNP